MTHHEIITFASVNKGPHLLVLGAVHGDEICGPLAIGKIIEQIRKGDIQLDNGIVTFLPVCNPRAYQEDKRYTEKNLNRVICHHEQATCYEEQLAPTILRLIDACDVLLDIHSATDPAFVFQDSQDPQTAAFARSLGLPHIITGWPEMYADKGNGVFNEGDTASYAIKNGKTAVVVECGEHKDPEAVNIGQKAIRNALSYLKMVKPGDLAQPDKFTIIRGAKVVGKNKPGSFVKDWKHLDAIAAGEAIALYEDGGKEIAEQNGFILLPKPDAKEGEEWFYLGIAQRIHVA